MKSISLDTNLLKKAAPSGEIVVFYKGKKALHKTWGKKYPYYDLASLTKILFTNELIFLANKEKLLKPSDPINKFLPYWHKNVKIENLLRHDSGYSWWKPFYKKIPKDFDILLKRSFLKREILKEKKLTKKKAVYSDIDYFILGFILEEIFSLPLESLLDLISSPFHFQLNNKIQKGKKEDYAPTEKCPWRKKRLQAEVHDQNAWALGGVAPHAGLFGGAKEIEKWFKEFRETYQKDPLRKKYTKRAIPVDKGDWALGYMMPTKGKSSCGDYFSAQSFGHTGFTGTSFWYDPRKDLAIVILSNRIYYGVSNIELKNMRPIIHNEIYKAII